MPDAPITQTPYTRPALYHYSDARGFLGVEESKSLWFSNIRYMNDSEEWSYALKMLQKVIREFDGIDGSNALQDAFNTICNIEPLHTHYTFSFTEESDLLSQWRGYCPNGGYSFALDNEHLDKFIDAGFLLEPCIYEEEKQRQFILARIIGTDPDRRRQSFEDEKIRRAEGRYIKGGSAYEFHQNIYPNIIRNSKLLVLLKHPSFREEREWRLLASYDGNTTSESPKFGFRVSGNMVVPYLVVKIPLLTSRVTYPGGSYHEPTEPELRISEVVVGPTPHQGLALAACRMMVRNSRSSETPYVSW